MIKKISISLLNYEYVHIENVVRYNVLLQVKNRQMYSLTYQLAQNIACHAIVRQIYIDKGQLISKCPYENQFGQNTNGNISALEVYYFKVNTKRESIFCLQEDRLCFVVTLK